MGSEEREPANMQRLVVEMRRDVNAFGELYRFYQPRIFRFVVSRVGNRADAEDITEMTFEKALRNVDKYDPERARFFTWLYQIANNTITDYRRRGARREVGFEDCDWGQTPGSDDLEGTLSEIEVYRLLSALPRSYQEVLSLRFVEGLGIDEIAEVLECSKTNVSTRIYRGLNAAGKIIERRERSRPSVRGSQGYHE